MVVDDEVAEANKTVDILRTSKSELYEVISAYSTDEALGQIENNKILSEQIENRIRLIFLDVGILEIDGIRLFKKIRNEYGSKKIQIIVMGDFPTGQSLSKELIDQVSGNYN